MGGWVGFGFGLGLGFGLRLGFGFGFGLGFEVQRVAKPVGAEGEDGVSVGIVGHLRCVHHRVQPRAARRGEGLRELRKPRDGRVAGEVDPHHVPG